MPELVHGDVLQHPEPSRRPPRAHGGDQGGVLHPARFLRAAGREHHGEVGVGVGAEAPREGRDHPLGELHHALGVGLGAGGVEHAQREPAGLGVAHAVGVPGGPREVVHAVGEVAVHVAVAAGRVTAPARSPLAPTGHRVGHVERHVVAPEVCVELAVGVEGKARPAPVGLQHRELREPLRHHVKSPVKARARDERRERAAPAQGQRHGGPGGHLLRQRDAELGLVTGGVRGVRRAGQEVGAVFEAQRGDLDPAPLRRRRLALAPPPHEEGVSASKRVEVEVKPQLPGGHPRGVGPAHGPLALDHVGDRVERGAEGVVHHPLRELRWRGGGHRHLGLGRAHRGLRVGDVPHVARGDIDAPRLARRGLGAVGLDDVGAALRRARRAPAPLRRSPRPADRPRPLAPRNPPAPSRPPSSTRSAASPSRRVPTRPRPRRPILPSAGPRQFTLQ